MSSTNLTEYASSPTVVVTAGASGVTANWLVQGLPLYINIILAIYMTVMLGHKLWQVYKEFKKNASS